MPVVATAGHRLMITGIAVMVATGIPLFLSEAIKCYYSPAFWVKISTLVPAVLFALFIRRRVAARAERYSRAALVLTGVVSMSLWFTVAAAGRWIGFS
jgi:hypothetical protein